LFHKIEATGGAEAAAQRAAGINSLLLASRLLAAAAVGIGGSGRECQQQQHKSGATMSHQQQQQRGEMLADRGEEDSLLPFAGSMGTWEQDEIGTREHPHVPPLLLFPFLERFSNFKFNFSEFQQSMNKNAK